MKLAFALFEYFPYGGLQRDMLAIAGAALARGHQVTVYTRQWQGATPKGPKVVTLPVDARSNHARDAGFAAALAPRLAGFDSVVGFNKMPGLDWYYAADGCLAARYHGPRRWLPRYRSKLAFERAVFEARGAARILSISPPQRALYQRHYGTADARFVDLPPGIRRDRAQPEDVLRHRAMLRTSLGLEEHSPMLLFVGSGFRTKGLDRAIRTLAGLPAPARLYVVGEDRATPYRRLARKLGVAGRVHFMGGQDNVPEWLWSADLLLHPAYAENTGTVLLEAAIAGLPVLTTEACGYAPYIGEGELGQVLAEPSDEQLVQAAGALLEPPRERWRERSRAFAAGADIYDLVEHAVDAIEQTPRQERR
ncbi:glycosyltransferase family 4 protein [Alloalcanivorax mobilis]|uniref:glycosyltransferase family 4 protein n=1 Tax=Alloalcanivorax mobilis TaxID=2019569 RepID=UPI000B5B390D|nr:glycosyltransferase family 4 protein [Alloalcanivorax mobilis]ASK35497.1 glycosyl transferase family 1 [Alcanivorax sp. N3-2A]|tara:strand:- start:2236 stop:3330 length:1095 start_codon:yes stop_codon:yes gene_type:complete